MSTLPTVPDEHTLSLFNRADEIIERGRAVSKTFDDRFRSLCEEIKRSETLVRTVENREPTKIDPHGRS